MESSFGEVKVFMDDAHGFNIYYFNSTHIERFAPQNATPDVLGSPVKLVILPSISCICYKSKPFTNIDCGLLQGRDANSDFKSSFLTWRYPLTFASKNITNPAKIGTDYLVAGSTSVIDVINVSSGKIVHVFETKKDKIRSLGLLASKEDQLYLLAEEEREGKLTAAIISIEMC